MLYHIRFWLAIFFGFSHCVTNQIIFPNTCPEVKVLETFDVDAYMGTWYEYSKYPFIFEMGQKCQSAVYKNIGNDIISVVNTGVFIIINKPNNATGTAKVLAPGQLAVSFRKQKTNTANYLVLGTDYVNWAVVYSCKNITSYSHAKMLWILTRQRQPSEESIQSAKEIIKDNKLSEIFIMKSSQTDCPSISESNSDDEQIAEAPSTTIGDDSSIEFSSTSTERYIDTA